MFPSTSTSNRVSYRQCGLAKWADSSFHQRVNRSDDDDDDADSAESDDAEDDADAADIND